MARYIPDDVLDRIRLSADIIDVVQSYVPTLKKMGQTWKACCPFHHEKTPSFVVNPSRQIFKCFGCGKGGNVFSFIMEMEKLDFPNAAELLARKYNIIIPDEPKRQFHRGPEPVEGSEKIPAESSYHIRERLYTLHEKLMVFYHNLLLTQPDSPVAQYFKTRQIPNEWSDKFMIGCSPDSWDAAMQFAQREGFSMDELKMSGIVSENDNKPGHLYDRFRNRLMFPIWNEQGRVVAFSARSIEKDPKGWKYVNSPESPIFKKGKTLYALHFARSAIVEKKYAVMCEGQLDTIALHRVGCTNAVAPQGTAFGADQGNILKRMTDTICLASDNDSAGRAAVFKDAAILLPLGFYLKVAVYSGAKDADEVLKTQGPDALRGFIENAADFFDFALNVIKENTDVSTPAGKSIAASELMKWLLLIESPVTRELYAAWTAEKLSVPKEMIELEIQKKLEEEERRSQYTQRFREERAREQRMRQPVAEPQDKPLPPGLQKAYSDLLELLLKNQKYAGMAVNDLPSEILGNHPFARAIEIVIQAQINGEWEDSASQISMEFTKKGYDMTLLSGILVQPEKNATTENISVDQTVNQNKFDFNTYNSCLRNILFFAYSDERDQIVQKALTMVDGPEKMQLLKRYSELSKELLQLRKKLVFKV